MSYRHTKLARSAEAGRSLRILVEQREIKRSETWFFRITTIFQLASSIVLAGAALWLSGAYQAQQREDQKALDARSERQALFSARYYCRDLSYKALQAIRRPDRVDERIDAITFIGEIDADCRRVGEPIGRLIGPSLSRLAHDQSQELRQPLEALRRRLQTPLPPAIGDDLSMIVETSGAQLNHVGQLVDIAAYGGGAVISGTGLLNFKRHVDDPAPNEPRKALNSNDFNAVF
jgi:hypothetical protein